MWFEFVTTLKITVLAGLKVGQANHYLTRCQGFAHLTHTFCQGVNSYIPTASFNQVQWMFMNEGSPDEFFPHEADTITR